MKHFWYRLRSWWGRLWHRLTPTPAAPPALYRAAFVEDDLLVPQQPADRTVYIVGVRGNEWLAVMACPCGCGDTLPMNLLPDEMPNWSWAVNADGVITLNPSVWRKVRCGSHFFLRDGEIRWCDA